jgi:ADP-heptose:LPS heptosyltransferase
VIFSFYSKVAIGAFSAPDLLFAVPGASEMCCYLGLESLYSIKFQLIRMAKILYNVLLFGSILLSRLRMTGVLGRENLKRILVVELTKLGDVLSMVPLLTPLKESFPHATIAVMLQPNHEKLFALVPEVSTTLSSPSSQHLRGIASSVRLIRRQKFDLVISASPSVRHGILVLLSGARYKFGFLEFSRAKVVHLQSHRVRSLGFRPQTSSIGFLKNINDRVEHLCRSLGVRIPGRKPALAFLRMGSPLAPKVAKTLLPANGSSYIVAHPSAGWEYRTWPTENFRSLVRRVLEVSTEHVVLVGAESDRSPLQPLIREFGGDPRVSFEIGLELDSLARMIANARLFVGSDSGPLHLAAAVGTPSVGLFGPAPPELTGSQMPMESHVYKRVECSPCDQEDCVRKWAPCMTLITVDEVLDKVREILVSGSKALSTQTALPTNLPKAQSPST